MLIHKIRCWQFCWYFYGITVYTMKTKDAAFPEEKNIYCNAAKRLPHIATPFTETGTFLTK